MPMIYPNWCYQTVGNFGRCYMYILGILLLVTKVSRKFKNYFKQTMSLKIKFYVVDRKKEGKPEFWLDLILSVPERCCYSAKEQGKYNSLANSVFSLLLTPNIPYRARFSLLHYQYLVQLHIFRSFLLLLSFIIRTRICSRTGVPSSCEVSLFLVSSCPHEDKLWVSWLTWGFLGAIDTHYFLVLHLKSMVSPLFTCAPFLSSLLYHWTYSNFCFVPLIWVQGPFWFRVLLWPFFSWGNQ